VLVDEDISATKHLNVGGNANITGDIAFNGPNKWIIHTPDDARRIMYIAPGNEEGKWMWDKQTMLSNNGNVQLSGGLMLGGQEIPHPDTNGAFYKADGQVQLATNDLIRLRHVASKQTGIQFDTRPGAGDIREPNGQMKITRQGIMFGGPNDGREPNSGQISAGLHHPNSLNIVGMSADKAANSRRVDMWTEGGFSVFGPQKINGPRIDTDHVLNKQAQSSGQSVNSIGGGWISADMGAQNDQPRVVIGNLGNRATIGAHTAKLDGWAPLHLNPGGAVIINNSDGGAILNVKGSNHEHGTAWLRSDKGPMVSHVHLGNNGDWYLRSANAVGSVNIQDAAPNGYTNIGSNLNLKGGVSRHNPGKWGTHFPFVGDQKNYIRGDTEIRGDVNNIGELTTTKLCIGNICLVEKDGTIIQEKK